MIYNDEDKKGRHKQVKDAQKKQDMRDVFEDSNTSSKLQRK